MHKIVIDTNLLIDGASDDYNYGNRIIDEVLAGRIEAYANRASLRENEFISRQKVHDPDYNQKLEKYFEVLKPAPDDLRVDVVEDREDNKILASAVAVGAGYLITSDWHLLKLEEYEGVRIVRPEHFWTVYEEETNAGWGRWLKDFMS